MKNMNFPRAGELHRRAGRQAAPQDGQVYCTTLRRCGGLHIMLGCGKGRAGGLPFSAARPAIFRSPTDRLFCAARRPTHLSCEQHRDVAGRKFLSSACTAPKVSVLCSHRVHICCAFPCPQPHCTAPPHTFRVLTPNFCPDSLAN